jgi:hypothetical protein
VVINLFEYLFNGILLMNAWSEALRALQLPETFSAPQMVAFNTWGFLMGLAAIWLYSQIRLRYGPGFRAAFFTGLAMWVVGYALPAIPSTAMALFPTRLMVFGLLIGLVEICIATILGAWVYRPPAITRPAPAS